MLYAVALKKVGGFEFRAPTNEDLVAIGKSTESLEQHRASWDRSDLLPHEPRQAGRADWAAGIYGLRTWADTYSPRQLLSFGVFAEEFTKIKHEILTTYDRDNALAIVTYLAFAFDKALNYNSMQVTWHASRSVIAPAFQRHDLSFKWTFAEFDCAGNLLPWSLNQVIDSYDGLAKMTTASKSFWPSLDHINNAQVLRGSASELNGYGPGSVDHICVDPPYYDNVQYAELADYFYVWLKRIIGDLYGDWFEAELTNKEDEAVSTPTRFVQFGPRRKLLARQDYEFKIAAAFREMNRVLKPNGVLTVMFTHKKVEAWDTLASALIGAGFTIQASWPVHTESEHSLHQAKKNAASSTILLVCRKRKTDGAESVWWDDLQARVRETARSKAAEFAAEGIRGVDLYISTFGPTLSIISEHWPVLTSEVDAKTGEPKPLRPETALELARQEVVRLQKQRLLLGRNVQFDPITDWYIMAWDAFQAEQFPYDEARKLAIALDVDLDKIIMKHERLVVKKGNYVVMQTPTNRRHNGLVDEEVEAFDYLIDAVHTAMMIYQEDGAGACDVFLLKRGLKSDTTFKACLQALLNAIPRTRIKGKFTRPEAEILENMRLAWFEELQVPVEEEPELPQATQIGLGAAFEQEIESDDEEEESEEE